MGILNASLGKVAMTVADVLYIILIFENSIFCTIRH